MICDYYKYNLLHVHTSCSCTRFSPKKLNDNRLTTFDDKSFVFPTKSPPMTWKYVHCFLNKCHYLVETIIIINYY